MHALAPNQPGARLGRTVVLGLVVAALGALAAATSSCDGEPQPTHPKPPSGHSIAGIRVRLTARGCRSAKVRTTGGYRLSAGSLTVAESELALPPTTVQHIGRNWRFGDKSFPVGRLVLEPRPGSLVGLGGVRYRGNLHIVPVGTAALVVVNHVDVESYLAGVLAKELYRNWHIEAYRALAVAARTFALSHVVAASESRPFDLGSGQDAQVYGGQSAETPRAWQAVRSTHGQVLAYGPPGKERIFLTQYSSCCGGRVNPAAVLRNAKDIEPLAGGQECDDCRACPYYRWEPVTIAKSRAYQALARSHPTARRLVSLESLRVTSRTRFGRPIWLNLIGTSGKSMDLRAESLRLSLLRYRVGRPPKLWSTNCRIEDREKTIVFADGRGFGHGVGLCQWGAQGKAAGGWTGEQILNFYYPGAKRFRVY